MKIDWMTKDELTQAIPPAYTEFLGKHLAEVLVKADGGQYQNGFEFHNCDGTQFLKDYLRNNRFLNLHSCLQRMHF